MLRCIHQLMERYMIQVCILKLMFKVKIFIMLIERQISKKDQLLGPISMNKKIVFKMNSEEPPRNQWLMAGLSRPKLWKAYNSNFNCKIWVELPKTKSNLEQEGVNLAANHKSQEPPAIIKLWIRSMAQIKQQLNLLKHSASYIQECGALMNSRKS